ncbi:MAG: prepilin-type N-terminal cleavage/methylation domain-containing protein [Deltaproteobacteria bacterium]|nr:prepilin-type N-terminal cleavage/methylation domain-containing protein [Deltaproteobacteria bacterium]
MIRNNEKGFTLIELLVVIAIIGILAAIAIPQFAAYKKTAVCSSVASDVANTVIALEGFYAKTQTYDGFNGTVKSGTNVITPSAAGSTITNVTGTNPDCDQGTFTFADGKYAW